MTMADETSTTSPSFLADMRARLVAERDEFIQSIEIATAEAPHERSDVTDGPGETENLVTAEHHEVAARVEALARASIAEIDAALARIDAGTYGQCSGCGTAIPPERLDAMPAAAHCVTCKQQVEGR